jgi:DNA-binding NarL/FixJ family response regulator
MTMESSAMVLIVAKPGPLRDSLRFFLLTLPQVEMVKVVEDVPSALGIISARGSGLVLIDTSPSCDEVFTALRRIKAEGSQIRFLVLADDRRQQEEAKAAGADIVLFKGFPAAKLFSVIEDLVSDVMCGGGREPLKSW